MVTRVSRWSLLIGEVRGRTLPTTTVSAVPLRALLLCWNKTKSVRPSDATMSATQDATKPAELRCTACRRTVTQGLISATQAALPSRLARPVEALEVATTIITDTARRAITLRIRTR